jgi:hypothetical protein
VKLWKWESENLPSVKHSARTAIAATVSLTVARLFQLPEAYWAAIATLVVMQSTLGATLVISVERIAATALGALAGTPAQHVSQYLAMPLEEHVAFLKQEELTLDDLLKCLPIPNRPYAQVRPRLPPYFGSRTPRPHDRGMRPARQ